MSKQKKVKQLNPSLSVDCAIFGFDGSELKLLLIERSVESCTKKLLTLPGDLIFDGEDLDTAASRVLKELTGLKNIFMKQVRAFGDPKRLKKREDQAWLRSIRAKPEERVVTIAYYSLVNMNDYTPKPSSFAQSARWVNLDKSTDLAFDHQEIAFAAFDQLKINLKNHPIGFNLLPVKFTFSDLQKLYEVILGRTLDKRNFRRKMLKLKLVEPLNEKEEEGVPHKRSQLFQFNTSNYVLLLENGFDNFGF